MLDALRFFMTKQPLAFGIFAAAVVVTLFFAVQFLLHIGHFHDPGARDPALEPWMRPRYVAMAYHVPPAVMREEILGIGPPPKERDRETITMGEIARQRGLTLGALTETVRAGVDAFHAGHGK
jgi:hypothetical protein